MHLRRKGREPDFEPEHEVESPAESASQRVRAKETRKVLLRAMTALPLDLQIAVELFYWEGFSAHEIGVSLKISDGTVRSRLFRARELLHEQLRTMDINAAVRASTITHLAMLPDESGAT